MTREQAESVVDAIFDDLRGRRFLKWLFAEDPERMGVIMHQHNGDPLMALDADVQAEIREAWIKIVMRADLTGERG